MTKESEKMNNQYDVNSRGISLGNVLKGVGVGLAITAGLTGCGGDNEDPKNVQEKIEQFEANQTQKLDGVVTEVVEVTGALTERQDSQEEILTQTGVQVKKIVENAEAHTKNYEVDKKAQSDINKKSEEKSVQTNERVDETNEALGQVAQRTTTLESNIPARANAQFEHADYRLSREQVSDTLTRIILAKGNDVQRTISIQKYKGGDADITVGWDQDKDGSIESNEYQSRLYTPNATVTEIATASTIIENFAKASNAKDDKGIEAAIAALEKVGMSSSINPLDTVSREVVELFRHVGADGEYQSDSTITAGDYQTIDDVTVVKTGSKYVVKSGKDKLVEFDVTATGIVGKDYRVSDAARQAFTSTVDQTYLDEIAGNFDKANENGRQAAKAEAKAKAESAAYKLARGQFQTEDIADGAPGLKARTVQGETSGEHELGLGMGDKDNNFSLFGHVEYAEGESNGNAVESNLENVQLRFDRKASSGKIYGVELFGETSSVSEERPGEAPVVTTSTDGRFTETYEDLGSSQETVENFGSVSFNIRTPKKSSISASLFGGNLTERLNEVAKSTTHDNWGIITPDIVLDFDIGSVLKSSHFGGQVIGEHELGSGNVFGGLISYDKGKAELIVDGINFEDFDFQQLRVGAFYRLLPTDTSLMRLNTGLVYSSADANGENANGLDGFFGCTFKPMEGFVVSPGLGVKYDDQDSAQSNWRFNGSLYTAFGDDVSIKAFDQFQLDNTLREYDDAHTDAFKGSQEYWNFRQLLADSNAKFLVGVNLYEAFNDEMEKEVAVDGRIGLAFGRTGNKMIVPIGFSSGPDGYKKFSAEAGYDGGNWSLTGGYQFQEGDNVDHKDRNMIIVGLTGRF